MKRPPFRQRGFSLVEMGVVMVVVGIIGVVAWRWIATSQAPMTRPEMQRQLNEAQAGVEGFLLANHRLPCAAPDTGGTEDCGDATAVRFPWRTLGMGSEFAALHYGANRGGGADLAAVPAAVLSQKSMMAQTSGCCCSSVVATVRAVVTSQLLSGAPTISKPG